MLYNAIGITQSLVNKQDGSGRVAVHEIMIVNHAIRNLIRENKITQINTVIQTGANLGMQTMDQHLIKLIRSGEISVEDGKYLATQKNAFAGL